MLLRSTVQESVPAILRNSFHKDARAREIIKKKSARFQILDSWYSMVDA